MTEHPITVACVLRSGGIYDPGWVARLRAGVARHLDWPHRFVALSDIEVPAERQALIHDWPGWWAKIELFRPGLWSGPVLFLDLDSLAVGPLGDIARAATREDFVILRDFYRPAGWGSGLMAFRPSAATEHLYRAFAADPAAAMAACPGGDQHWIERNLAAARLWQDLVPGQILSFKADCDPRAGPPDDARLICFHGRPKPCDLGGWVRQHWQES